MRPVSLAIIAGLIVVVAPAVPAMAQSGGLSIPPLVTDPTVLSRCVARTPDPLDCIGAMTEVCRAENDIENQNLEERRCVIAEYHVWNDLAGAEAAAVRERASQMTEAEQAPMIGPPAPAFDAAERAWSDWSQAECRARRAIAGRAARRAIIEDTCLRDLAAGRFARLVETNQMMGLK